MNAQPAEFSGLWGADCWAEGILTRPRAFIWVIVSALTLRGIAWFRYDPVTFDSAIYFEMAALILGGRWSEALAYDYPPLYPLLIAVFQPLVGSAEAAGLLVAFLADLFLLWPILAIARRAVGEEAAWGAAFVWAVHLSTIRSGVHALSDAPTAMCVATALAVGLWALEQRRLSWALGAGMMSGLAFLFRPEGLEPTLALVALYAFSQDRSTSGTAEASANTVSGQRSAVSGQPTGDCSTPSSRAGRTIRRVSWVLAPLAGWVLVAGPYVTYISAEAGTLTLSKKKSAASFVGSAVWLTPPDSRSPLGEDREQEKPARLPTANWTQRSMRSVYVFQKPIVNGLTAVIIVPACMGLVGILARRKDRWNPALGLLAGLFVLHFGILVGLAADKGAAYLGRHHTLLLVLYALPVAGTGLVWVLGWIGDRLYRWRWVPIMALCVIVVATGLAVVTRGPDQGRSVRTAAAWIRTQVVGTPIIVTRVAKLTYHANAERVDIAGTYEEILRRARDRSAHFVAIYPDLIGQTSPDFLAHRGSSDLELVKVFPEPSPTAPDQRLELYRLRPRQSSAGS